MFRIAVCDDHADIRTYVESILERHAQAARFSISLYPSGEALCDAMTDGARFELVILDIELVVLNGIAVGQFLRQTLKDHTAQILYLSAHQEYAMELFDLRPLNFLIKPLDEAKLLRCVDDALTLLDQESAFFSFTTQKQTIRIPLRDIRYLESCSRKLLVHTIRETYICYQKLSEAMEHLPYPAFFQIHKSFVVHNLHLTRIQYDSLTMDDGTTLSISQPYRKQVRELLLHSK